MSNQPHTKKSLWITWETQRRNRELAKAFNCELKQFDYSNLGRVQRYFKSIFKTFNVINSNKNENLTIFAQYPSLILCLQLVIFKPFFKYKLIIDAHNIIFNNLNADGSFIRFIANYVLKRTDFLIVSNQYLKKSIPSNQGKILVLPDKLPEIKNFAERPKSLASNKPNYVFISSFAKDEPIYNFLKAAKELTEFARFFITGKKSKAGSLLLGFESNDIIFTDYLTEKNFDSLITFSDMNIDLTTENNLLVCGAYESLAVGVPCILSDTTIQRETFSKGYLYTSCDSESLKETLVDSLKEIKFLKDEIIKFKTKFTTEWEIAFSKCQNEINQTKG